MRQVQRDGGERPGQTSAEKARIKELERENRELRQGEEQQTVPQGLLKTSPGLALRSCRKSLRCEQRCCDQDKQDRLRQSPEVDGGCGEKGLDFHVLAAASGGSCHTVTGFCQSVRAFDPPAVAGMKPGFGMAPGEAFAAGAQHAA